jgi:DsbC/DsbD-like thiol-disulfide interchange protein
VHWNTSVITQSAGRTASELILKLSGEIETGWHVYAMTQTPGGPNALRINLDDNQIVDPAGVAKGSPPHKQKDPRFGMVTQFYDDAFVLSLPVRLKHHPPSGRQQIPVSVRLQSCSAEVCLPPTTIHLSVDIDVAPTA